MTQQDSPSRHLDKFMLRMPDGMRGRIAEAAKENGRSMNAEIIHRLEQSFAEEKGSLHGAASLVQLLEHQNKTLAELAALIRQNRDQTSDDR